MNTDRQVIEDTDSTYAMLKLNITDDLLASSSPWHEIFRAASDDLREILTEEAFHKIIQFAASDLLGFNFTHHVTSWQNYRGSTASCNVNSNRLETEHWLKKKLQTIFEKRRINLASPINGMQESEAFLNYTIRTCVNRINQYISSLSNQDMPMKRDITKFRVSDVVPPIILPVRTCVFSQESETMGSILANMIEIDFDFTKEVCNHLNGYLLPKSLRQKLLINVLLNESLLNENNYDVSPKTLLQKHQTAFKASIEREIKTFFDGSLIGSSIAGLLHQNISGVIAQSPAIRDNSTERRERILFEVLSIVYAHNKTYEPQYIYNLYPLIITYEDAYSSIDELTMFLALVFAVLWPYCFPIIAEIHEATERVLAKLFSEDKPLMSHISNIANMENIKDLPLELMSGELKINFNFDEICTDSLHNSSSQMSLFKYLIRKWMVEMFTGILKLPSVMFVLDQLLMNKFKAVVLEDVSLSLIMLLREDLMQCKGHAALLRTMIQKPCKLYTTDIQDAVAALRSGQPLFQSVINHLNRNAWLSYSEKSTELSLHAFQPLQLRRITLSLNISTAINMAKTDNYDDIVQSHAILSLRASAYVIFSILFDNEIIFSKRTKSQPTVEKYLENSQSIRLIWPISEIISFHDIQSQSGSREAHARMYIELKYQTDLDGDDKLLGYAIISMKKLQNDNPNLIRWSLESLTLKSDLISLDNHHNSNWQSSHSLASDKLSKSIKSCIIASVVSENLSEHLSLQMIDPNIWTPQLQSTETVHITELTSDLDFYIDSIRYLPDNATIIKVAYSLFTSSWEKINFVPADQSTSYPILTSSAKCPKFTYRYSFVSDNSDKDILCWERNTILLIRILTVDLHFGNVAVLGNGYLPIFTRIDDKTTLNFGGHQLVIYQNLPERNQSLTMENIARFCVKVPAASIVVRLTPHTKDYVSQPEYTSGYYKTEACYPTKSEIDVINHYLTTTTYSSTVADITKSLILKDKPVVRQAAHQLMRANHDRSTLSAQAVGNAVNQFRKKVSLARSAAVVSKGIYDDAVSNASTINDANSISTENLLPKQHISTEAMQEINKYIKSRFRTKDQLSYLDLSRSVLYEESVGLTVKLDRLYGMQSKGYLNVFCYTWMNKRSNDEGNCLLLSHKRDCWHKTASPLFIDSQHKFQPPYGHAVALVLMVYGVERFNYIPTTNTQSGTTIAQNDPDLDPKYIGWSILPLFSSNCVACSKYLLPLYDNYPQAALSISPTKTISSLLQTAIKQQKISVLPTASLEISLWDGHFSQDECYPLRVNNDFFQLGDADRLQSTILSDTFECGTLMEFFIESLPEKDKKPSEELLADAFRSFEVHLNEIMEKKLASSII